MPETLDYPARRWRMSIDGQDISDGCILWGAMNIPSAGPALHLAPKAKTDDGLLNFVAVRERDRTAFIKHVDAHLAGRKERRSPRPRKFRKLIIHSLAGALHLDGRQWPSANKNNKRLRGAVEITLKPLP